MLPYTHTTPIKTRKIQLQKRNLHTAEEVVNSHASKVLSKNQKTPYNQISLSNNFMHTHRGLDWHPVALSDVYEAEIRRLRAENDTLKIHYDSVAGVLN